MKRRPRLVDKSRLLDAELARVLCGVGPDGSADITAKLAGVMEADAADVTGVIEVLKTALKRAKIADRVAALQALGYGASYAIDYAGGVRAELLETLPAIADAASANSKDVRRAALRALADFAPAAGVEVVAAITNCKATDATVDDAFAALQVLRACTADEAVEAVNWCRKVLAHESADVRTLTCNVLGWIGEEAASVAESLAVVAGQDRDHSVRQAAATALLSVDASGEQLRGAGLAADVKGDLLTTLRRLGPQARTLRHELQRALTPHRDVTRGLPDRS